MSITWDNCFFNGADTPDRSRAMIQNFIDGNPNCPLYIITSVDKRNTGYWEDLLDDFGLTVDTIIDSWYRLPHYDDVTGAHFIFDGDQIYSRAKWTRSLLKIVRKNNSWVAGANYNDSWINYAPLFIACGFYKNITEFQKEHVRFKSYARYPIIDNYVNVDKLRDILDKIRVSPPYRSEVSIS